MERIVRECEPTYAYLCECTEKLQKRYPFAEVGSIGTTCLGRKIPSVTLGSGDRHILYIGGTHAQEWMTTLLLLRFTEELLSSYAAHGTVAGFDARGLLSGKTLIIIPSLNPDGTEIALLGSSAAGRYTSLCENALKDSRSLWNANARGVDINHNFDASWNIMRELEQKAGINAPAPRRYGGTEPESEPETRAVTAFCRNNDISGCLSFHSQGEEIFWEYGENTPEQSFTIASALASACDYTLVSNSGLCSHAGFKDWFTDEFSRPAFTVEIGKGKNPLPLSQAQGIYKNLKKLMCLGILLL